MKTHRIVNTNNEENVLESSRIKLCFPTYNIHVTISKGARR